MCCNTIIINGSESVMAGSLNPVRDIESLLYSKGFKVYPKDPLTTNVCVENIQKYPEKFRRFIHMPLGGLNAIKYINNLELIDGKIMCKVTNSDGSYCFMSIPKKNEEYIREFYADELRDFLNKAKTIKKPEYIYEDREEVTAGGSRVIFKYIVGEKEIDKQRSTKESKMNTVTIEQPIEKEKEVKLETPIESFNDLMKSISPEQLNMKLNIAGEGEPVKEVTVSDFMNQINGFANALKNMEENTKSGTLIVGAPVEKAHTAKDIDFNNPEELVRVDSKEIKTPIMEPKEERFIVDNNQQEPLKEPQQPAQDNTIVVKDQQLASVITRLQAAGTFTVTMNIESGIIRVIVKDTNDKQIDNLCFTVDLDGVCQAPLRKMWFGLPEYPDFEPSYLFDDKSIEALFTGEGFDQLNVVFNKNTCDINRLVDIRSTFNNPDELVRVDEINYTHIAETLD